MTLGGRTKYVLVLIWSRELYELCSAQRGRGGNRHKWSNYLRMRSLFGSISSRLWPREAQPSSTTGCVISSLRPPRCARTFFPAESLAEGHFVRQLCHQAFLLSSHPSDGLLISSNKKLILDASAEGNTWCMYVSKTALWHVVNVNKLSSPFALKWNLHICCFWGKQPFVLWLYLRMFFK